MILLISLDIYILNAAKTHSIKSNQVAKGSSNRDMFLVPSFSDFFHYPLSLVLRIQICDFVSNLLDQDSFNFVHTLHRLLQSFLFIRVPVPATALAALLSSGVFYDEVRFFESFP